MPLQGQAVLSVELTTAKRIPGPVVTMSMGDTPHDTNSILQCSIYKRSNRFLKNVMRRVMNSIKKKRPAQPVLDFDDSCSYDMSKFSRRACAHVCMITPERIRKSVYSGNMLVGYYPL